MNEVRAEVFVTIPPAHAFELFTVRVDRWWRRGARYGGLDVLGHRFETHLDGRFLEIHGDGERELGRITVWEPPDRLGFSWRQSNWEPDETTEVQVTFTAEGHGTRVVLRHLGLGEIRSDVGCDVGYQHGWNELLGWFNDETSTTTTSTKEEEACTSVSRS